MKKINEREVFYIAGYDPRGYRYYYSLYKKNSKKYNKISNINIEVSKTKKVNKDIYSWNINTKENTKTVYSFLSWNDIIQENWPNGFLKNFLDTLYFIKMYLFSGICVRFAKESKTQLIAGLFPLFYLFLTLIFSIFISYKIYSIGKEFIPTYISVVIAFLSFYLFIKLTEKIGDRIAVFWLSRIYAFSARWSEGKITNIEDRIEYFANHIFEKIKISDNENKEFILSSHSVGTILAVRVSNKVIKKCIDADIEYKNFKLLTLGNCIPLLSYQRKSLEYKKDLEEIGKTKNFTWIDYTATIDGACFPLVDPIVSSGLKKEEGCGAILQSTRFFKLFKKENYKKIKKQKYKAHFLYLMATDLLGNYDYFDITTGTKPLEFRIENYMKEK